ncbi:MAG: IS6 family transposase [Actinomycetota bacterium]
MLQRIAELLRGTRIFRRRRTSELTKALAVVAYHGGLSLRRTAKVLRVRRSHETVRRWYRRCRDLFPAPEKRERRALALDETHVRIGKAGYYLWAAIDLDTREVLAVHLTTTRSHLDAMMFLAKVVRCCTNRPLVYVDGGPWYPWALRRYGFPYEWRTVGPRSAIERWFGLLKRRTRRFHNVFPYGSSERSTLEWMETWVRLYNWEALS